MAAALGDRLRGSGGLQAQLALAGSLIGLWSCAGINCPQEQPIPCSSPATSTGQTIAGACPRILGQASCLSWAHLLLSTLPCPQPPPHPSPSRPRGARRSEVRGQRKHAGPTSRRYCFPDEAGGRLSTLMMGSCWGSWVRKVKSV